MTKNKTPTPVYLDPGMHSGLEVKGLNLHVYYSHVLNLLYRLNLHVYYNYVLNLFYRLNC